MPNISLDKEETEEVYTETVSRLDEFPVGKHLYSRELTEPLWDGT